MDALVRQPAVPLREEDVEAHVRGICFKTGPPGRTGVELEWLVRDRRAPAAEVPAARLEEVLAPLRAPGGLPGGGVLTREPGGQLELSGLPATSPALCAAAAAHDLAALRRALDAAGLVLDGSGLDPWRTPPRVLHHPRYRAMERHFDRDGPWGRTMMRSTAALQVSVDAGDDSDGVAGFRFRWLLAHRLGPVLIAAFANSPLDRRGSPSGWVSSRQAVWACLDPSRTRRPPGNWSDPRGDWARYALDARVMCVRRPPPAEWTAPPDLSLRSWLRGGAGGRRPTLDDVDYHLTTLFPPVRPRGWLELRMIDAQPGDSWTVPLLVTAALLDDATAAGAAFEATGPLTGDRAAPPWDIWLRAARTGPADPVLGTAVRACLVAALGALDRSGAPGALRRGVSDFIERYAQRGRCPADDALEAVRRGDPPHPTEGAL